MRKRHKFLAAAPAISVIALVTTGVGATAYPNAMVDQGQSNSVIRLGDSIYEKLAPGLTYSKLVLDAKNTEQGNWFISLGLARTELDAQLIFDCAARLNNSLKRSDFEFTTKEEGSSINYSEFAVGIYQSRAEAQRYLDQLPSDLKCKPELRHSGMYKDADDMPALVHVLRIEPNQFDGELVAARGSGSVIGSAKPSDVMKTVPEALAATNGGYFVMNQADGLVGESAGISVLAGRLVSEPTRGRPWVMIQNKPKLQIEIRDLELNMPAALTASDGTTLEIDGVNRWPGLLRNCGSLNNEEFAQSVHDMTCRPENELILIQKDSGIDLPMGSDYGIFAVSRGGEISIRPGRIDRNKAEYILAATGSKRSIMTSLVQARQTLALSMDGKLFESSTHAVNAGPTLLKDGKFSNSAGRQGWPFAASEGQVAMQMHRFINMRAPRTAIGKTRNGEIIIVVVDGWRFRSDDGPVVPMSGGATINELAEIMKGLGAVDAINLDGGGSSAMVTSKGLRSNPSDPTGERSVGDSLVIRSK